MFVSHFSKKGLLDPLSKIYMSIFTCFKNLTKNFFKEFFKLHLRFILIAFDL